MAAGARFRLLQRPRPRSTAGSRTCWSTWGPAVDFEGRIPRGTIILVTQTIVYDILEQMSDPHEAISHYSTELDTGLAARPAAPPGGTRPVGLRRP